MHRYKESKYKKWNLINVFCCRGSCIGKLCTVRTQRSPTLIVIARVFVSMTRVSDVENERWQEERGREGRRPTSREARGITRFRGDIFVSQGYPSSCSFLSLVSQPDSERSNHRFVARFLSSFLLSFSHA